MMNSLLCPRCRKRYPVEPGVVGKRMRCDECQTLFVVRDDLGHTREVTATPRPASANREIPVVELAEDEEERRPAGMGWTLVLVGGGLVLLLVAGGIAGAFVYLASRIQVSTVTVTAGPSAPPPRPGPAPAPAVVPKPAGGQPAPAPAPEPAPRPPVVAEPEEEPAGPMLEADPPREPLQAPLDPRGTVPLPPGLREVPTQYPWMPSPVVAVKSAKASWNTWDVWSLHTMKQLGSVRGIGFTCVSPDGRYLAIPASERGTLWSPSVEVFTVADGKPLCKIRVKEGTTSEVGITEFPGPDRLFSVEAKNGGGEVKLWDVKTGKEIIRFPTAGMVDRKWAALSPGGRYLAIYDTLALKNLINIYELGTGKVVRTIRMRLPLPGFYIYRTLAFSPDGKELAGLFTSDRQVDHLQAWSFETGKQTASLQITPELSETAGVKYPPYYRVPLTWLPDRSGWLAYGQLMIDREDGRIFWTLPQDDATTTQWVLRRFLDERHISTVVGRDLAMPRIEIVTLPKEEIEAARRK